MDALALAVLLGLTIAGIITLADLIVDGTIDPAVLALAAAMLAPLVPALIARRGREDDD